MCNKFITGNLAKTVKKRQMAVSGDAEDEKDRNEKIGAGEKQGVCLFSTLYWDQLLLPLKSSG